MIDTALHRFDDLLVWLALVGFVALAKWVVYKIQFPLVLDDDGTERDEF
ncbi:hypothetical protein [Telluribacter humicola]|nr:hypothetical protein [Telluribacter humicola]